jgi:ABC-type glutathione transport system ATPase component
VERRTLHWQESERGPDGKIVVREVSRTFVSGPRQRHELQALDRVSLEIADQEIVCLVGPSGCGKSTPAQHAGRASTLRLAAR